MKKHIALRSKAITYTLKKSKRARRMRLAVYCDGAIVITAPISIQEDTIERFIKEKTEWLFSKIDFFKQFKGKSIASTDKKDYTKFKEIAHTLATRKVEQFNKIYKFNFNSINIKNQKTRWGSCSKKGNLNFNYKIALLPERVTDYIVVHELCHLKEFNHSQKYWKLVSKAMPDYQQIREDLKHSGINFL